MGSSRFSSYSGLVRAEDHDEPKEEEEEVAALLSIPQPQTPKEPMEFLSRSWTLTADQISSALAASQSNNRERTVIKQSSSGATAIGRLFNHREGSTMRKKDKARLENAHTHALVSVAGLAAALASFAATDGFRISSPETSIAFASATDLLASYCIELAASGGAHHEHVTSTVRSAVKVHTASHLSTLTAAAATKEARRSGAAVSPYEKGISDSPQTAFHSEMEEEDLPCVGNLLQLTDKGMQQWKHVSVYINEACEVTMKLRSKHIGGAFYRKNKCIVYEVVDESDEWPFRKRNEYMEVTFGVKTSQGLLEFKCRNKVHKQKWVCGIRKLLERSTSYKEAEDALRMLTINKSI